PGRHALAGRDAAGRGRSRTREPAPRERRLRGGRAQLVARARAEVADSATCGRAGRGEATSFQGRASKIRLNGLAVARRKLPKPASSKIAARRLSAAWAPSAMPTSSDSECGQQIAVDPQ